MKIAELRNIAFRAGYAISYSNNCDTATVYPCYAIANGKPSYTVNMWDIARGLIEMEKIVKGL